MIKKTLVTILSVVLMGLAVSALKNKEFYTSEQLDTARNKAVDQARNGDFESALRRLKVLSKYDSKNAKVWYDYLTVLYWAKQHESFFENIKNIQSDDIPDYFLETSLDVIKTLKSPIKNKQASQLFEFLFNSKGFLDSHFLIDTYEASKLSHTDDNFINLLNQSFIDPKYSKKITLYNLSNMAKNGKLDESIQLFDEYYQQEKNNPNFIAEYLTVNNWARNHEKVITTAKSHDLSLLPEYAVKSIADSYQSTGNLQESKKHYQRLEDMFITDGEYIEKINHLDLEIIEIAKIKKQQELKSQQKIKFQLDKENAQLKLEQDFLNLSINQLEEILVKLPYSQKHYDRWNELAKNNNYFEYGSKLSFYKKSVTKHPIDSLFYYDYLVLLSWNGEFKKAINLYKDPGLKFKKLYFYTALANAATQNKDFKLSLSLYDIAIELETNDKSDLIVDKANVLQELKQPQISLNLLSQLDEFKKLKTNVMYSQAGAYRQLGQSLLAIDFYNKILKNNPNSKRALFNKGLTLIEANLPFYAFEILQAHPNLFNFEQKLEIYSGINTYKVKLAIDESNPLEHNIAIQDSLEFNSDYITFLKESIGLVSKTIYAIADKAILLHLDKDYQQVLDIYEKHIDVLPIYALNVISSSALALKLPKQSLAVSEKVLKARPNDFNALVNAYYTYLELEDFSNAFQYLQKIDEQSGIWLYSSDGRKSIENPAKESVLLLKIMHIAYKNTLGKAQIELEKLLKKAPLNSNYRVNLAKIYQWRGWYEKSQEQLNIIANSDPNFITLNISQSSLWLEQKKYKKSEDLLDELLSMSPLPDSVKLQNLDWQLHNSHILSVSYEKSDTDGSDFSSKDKTYSASFYSKPIAYNWRIYGYYKDTFSQFFNQDDHITTQGLGVNYRQTWGEASISLFNVEGKTGQEFAIQGTWEINDYTSVNAQYQSFGDNTPVRAFHTDVYTDSISFGLTHNPNEEYQYQGNLEMVDFTDGNKRTNLSLSAYQPLYRDEHHILSIWEYAYVQHNSSDTNREYFNPESFYSISGALDYTGIIRRNYDDVFSHSARVGFGYSKQNNFSAKPFLDIDYLHRWDISKYFHLYYGIGYRQNHYDGISENGPKIKAGLEYKF